jgi:hypothetical protein
MAEHSTPKSVAEVQTLAAEARAETEAAAREAPHEGATTTFTSAGQLPGVAEPSPPEHHLSASDRAFKNLHDGESAVVWRGGEPLPVLKDLFFAPTTDHNLATFMRMIDHAPVRPGTHGIRTPLSPADGLATIITDFVLRVCNKYLPYCKDQKEPKRHAWLERTITHHLILLNTPSWNGYRSGGHLTRGMDGKLDALIGSTTPMDVAINQTAITLWTLEEMRENPDPRYQHLYGHRVRHLLEILFPEFRRELVRCYPPGVRAHHWHYSLQGRLEDQGHLKTTWSQLDRLGNSTSTHASWYRREADRIAKASPHVLAPWDQQSGIAGSVH